MQNVVLQTRVLNESHTGLNIRGLLHDACLEWHITESSCSYPGRPGARNMILAGCTLWNSSCEILECFLKQQAAVEETLILKDFRKGEEANTLKD